MHLRRIILTGAAVAAIAGTGIPAFAADATDVVVTAGSLAISTITVGDFAGVTLDGTAKSTTATMNAFNVNDARATGAGWNVTVQASRFTEWDATLNAGAGGYVVSGAKTLALSSLSMPAPTVAANGTTSAAPSITSGPYAIDAAGAVKIASAAADQGMGIYDFTQVGSLTLSVPASTYARTYRSDVTVSVATGP